MSAHRLIVAALLKLIDETNEGPLGSNTPKSRYYFRNLEWRIKHFRAMRMRLRDKMTYFEISEVEKCTTTAAMRRVNKVLVYISAETGLTTKLVKQRLPFVFQSLRYEWVEV